jgi:glucokinase
MSYLGVEIGGTKVQVGVGRDDGRLLALWRGTVDTAAGADGIRRQIVEAVPEVLARAGLARAELRGAGIGFGGPVDDATRTVIRSHQIAGWDDFPLADWVADAVGLPAVLGNDADVAGLAEALHGAGKGMSPIFYITIGSGIGGGLIIDGEIYRGCGRGAAEIGHLQFDSEEVTRSGGGYTATGPVEASASGWAIERAVESRLWDGEGRDSLVLRLVDGQWERIDCQHVAEAARQGDVFAWSVLHDAWSTLASALCHVIALLCPRRIVIGGGVSLMGEELLFAPLRRMVAERVFTPFAGLTDIVPAALGEEVVVHGAIALARKKLER